MSIPAIDIYKLAPAERLQLIDELWESLRSCPESVPLTDAQRDELDRRLDAFERGEGESTPWDEVKRRLQGELE
jgi:putative addiction module component (TIGR02574 family)